MEVKEKLKRAWNRPPKKVRKWVHVFLYLVGAFFIIVGIVFSMLSIAAGYMDIVGDHLLLSCAGVSFALCGVYKQKQYEKYKDKGQSL